MVKYKIEGKDGMAHKGKAEMVLSIALDGDKVQINIVGNGGTADMIKGLSHMIAETAKATGKGFEFVQLVSAGATLVLTENGGGEGEE